MKVYGIKIETSQAGGRFQHKVYEIGVKPSQILPDNAVELSEKVVRALKRANELAWEEMPQGIKGLVSTIQYNPPKKVQYSKYINIP